MIEDIAWRQLLWLHHGCPLSSLYGDDGEMQCNDTRNHHRPIDFRRDSIDDIRFKFALPEDKIMEVIKDVFSKDRKP